MVKIVGGLWAPPKGSVTPEGLWGGDSKVPGPSRPEKERLVGRKVEVVVETKGYPPRGEELCSNSKTPFSLAASGNKSPKHNDYKKKPVQQERLKV